MNKTILLFLIALLIIGGAYWLSTQNLGDYGAPNTETSTVTEEEEDVNPAITGPVGVAQGPSGERLVDKSGFTLYVNAKDEGQTGGIKTSCNAQCERTWLPYLLPENESAITSSNDPILSKLNLFTRTDGKKQYALGTKPLYRHVNDLKAGDINGPVSGDWMVATP